MTQFKRAPIAGLLVATVITAAGCSGKEPGKPSEDRADTVSATTAPAVGDTGPITFAVYRATSSLDPITSFDIPENAIVTAMCETLLVQEPDLTVSPGLATAADYTDPTTLVLKLNTEATFWDGAPLSAEDVVFSLQRAANPKLGGYYAADFSRVSSIEATAEDEVTINLSEPDYWLRTQLSAMPGVVIEKKFAEQAGKKYGTPEGGAMCTGPFKFGSWTSGGDVVVERNDDYWNTDAKAKVPSITFTPVSNDANLTAGFSAGDIQGTYAAGLAIYDELVGRDDMTVTSGPSLVTDLLAVADMSGILGDEKVRQALSLGIDRKAYIDAVYSGQATLPRSISSPGSWGMAGSTFESTLGSDPELITDVDKAKALISEAGAEGKTLTMTIPSGVAGPQTMASLVKEAAESIGLTFKQNTFPLDKYNELFFNPEARKGTDVLVSLNNPIAPDPGPFLASLGTPDGIYNFTGWSNDQVTELLDQARATEDDAERAQLEAQADELITQGLTQIPMAHPYNVLYTSSDITGAPASYSFMSGPWANLIGAAAK